MNPSGQSRDKATVQIGEERCYVRALKDSAMGRNPKFRKGDILRKISALETGHPYFGDEPYFLVISLTMFAQKGLVAVSGFEMADEVAAIQMGENARTWREKEALRLGMNWERWKIKNEEKTV